MKKILLSTLYLFIYTIQALAQCGTPVTGGTSSITSTGATSLFGCNSCTGTQVLEYGVAGFVPGTGAAPGAGGTVVNFPTYTNSYTYSGLTPATEYDYYMRVNCGGGVFTPNTAKLSFFTAPNCGTAPAISCGTMVNVTTTVGGGAWSTCTNGYAKEKMYSFTPTLSGMHYLMAPLPNIQVYFSYKAASLGCTETNWTCMGLVSPNQVGQFAFGPLTAGTQYFILVDPNNPSTALNANFRIECPYCVRPTNITSTRTPYSITLNWTGSAAIVEYGTTNFVPGSGATAGSAASTVVTLNPGGTISNLPANTVYTFYLRTICGGSNYSPNSVRFLSLTENCPPTQNYGSLGTISYMQFNGPGVFPSPNGCSTFTPGSESIVNFTPPASGYYNLMVNNLNYYNGFGYQVSSRALNTLCNITGYGNCLGPSWSASIDNYTVGPLTVGTTYQFLFDVQDSITCQSAPCDNDLEIIFSCPKATGVTVTDIQSSQVTVSWTCNCPPTTYIEYGPPGFAPGAGATPGTNGTVISNVSSPYTLTGLAADTKYDIYVRSSCGGSFSTNTAVTPIRTAQNCATAATVSCNDYLMYQVSVSGVNAGGAWISNACGATNYQAREGVWRFTPAQTGTYSLLFYAFIANSINYNYPASFYIKQASLGCNEQNWNCLGTENYSFINFTPNTISLGTLTAGTTYLIMADGVQPTFTNGYTYYFRIDCPNVCEYPKLNNTTSITSSGATINAGCNTCFGNLVLEYGPAGFTPGTGSTAGVNGTVASVATFPHNLTGLAAGTYDVYARQNCGGGSFSVNCPKVTFSTTCNTAPTSITNSAGTNSICAGTSLTLTQVGGIPAAGGSMKWYTGSCGGTLVATGNSLTVTPAVSTVYYVRAEGSCGNSPCIQVSITVNPLPAATITAAGPTTFCAGGSVILNANTGAGLTYQWKKYGIAIVGATSSSYTASTNGNFKCTVTSAAGCSKTSGNITVTVNQLPSASITAAGPVSFCAGDSVVLTANAGAGLTYQWKKYANNIVGATAISYTAKTAGKYKCIVTNSLGCSRGSNTITVTIPCRTIDTQQEVGTFKVYPNPASGDVWLETSGVVLERSDVEVFDITGRVAAWNFEKEAPETIRISGLGAGIYFLQFRLDGELHTEKIVISDY